MNVSYHHRRKADHRAWLRSVKRQCERCSEHRSQVLTVLDRETGRTLGVSEGGWSMPITRRNELLERAIILCQRCGYRYRQEVQSGKGEDK